MYPVTTLRNCSRARRTDSKGETPASGAPGLVPVDLDLHILDRLAAVHRHRRLAITVFLLVVMVMMLQSYSTVPMFRAQARLLIEDERTTMVMAATFLKLPEQRSWMTGFFNNSAASALSAAAGAGVVGIVPTGDPISPE